MQKQKWKNREKRWCSQDECKIAENDKKSEMKKICKNDILVYTERAYIMFLV